jgi:hypothetical protein
MTGDACPSSAIEGSYSTRRRCTSGHCQMQERWVFFFLQTMSKWCVSTIVVVCAKRATTWRFILHGRGSRVIDNVYVARGRKAKKLRAWQNTRRQPRKSSTHDLWFITGWDG